MMQMTCYNDGQVNAIPMMMKSKGMSDMVTNAELLKCLALRLGKDDDTTFGEVANEWLYIKSGQVQGATFEKYESFYKHIARRFAERKLSDIKKSDIEKFLTELKDKHFSLWTIKGIKAEISSILDFAIDEDHLQKNVAKNVRLPKIEQHRKKPVHVEEFKEFLEASKGSRLQIAIPLLFLTGCRRGELLALTWDDIDFKKNVIHINKEYVIDKVNGSKKAVMRDHTKTEAGQRIVPLCKELKKVLTDFHKGAGAGTKYILQCKRKEKPIYPRNLTDAIGKWCKSLHIKGITPHSFRHGYAWNLLNSGVQPEDIKNLLGHRDLSTTLDIYCWNNKVSVEGLNRASKTLDKLYTKK